MWLQASFYISNTGFNIKIKTDNRISETIILATQGVCQGCSMSLILFSLYLDDEIRTWKMAADCRFKLNDIKTLNSIYTLKYYSFI